MKTYKYHEQKGVLALLFLIILSQFVYLLYLNLANDKNPLVNIKNTQLLEYQSYIDSLKEIEIEKRKPKIYPFNPSFITDYKGYKLGMSTKEIDRLLAHRKAGKYINSVEEFQQVTGVSDSLLAQLSPYFKFPDWVIKRNKERLKVSRRNKKLNGVSKDNVIPKEKRDINTAKVEDFLRIKGVGQKLAKRIVNYRKKLKGYLLDEQLYEVWYLDKEVADRVLQFYTVKKKPEIIKININTARFKEVLHAPYMNYDLTKKIFEYRDEMAEIQSMEELKKIEGFPVDKFDRISLYLTVE